MVRIVTFQAETRTGAGPASRLALNVLGAPAHAQGSSSREDMVRALLRTAADGGVGLVATRPHSDMERLLGQCWPFPSPFRVTVRTVSTAEGLDRVEARARRSLERMGLPRGEAIMVSSATDLAGAEGRALWDRMERLKDMGLFRRIGVCARVEDGPELLARRFRPDIVELPCNLLDQRAALSGLIEGLAGHGVSVQLRSIFAGGVLFAPREDLPPHLVRAGSGVSRARRSLAESRADPMQAALAYGLMLPGVETVSAGVASAAELRAVLAAAHAPAPDLDWAALALNDPATLSAAGPSAVSSAA
jgi:D-threo-aldose 1-dehydrogenase